MTAGPTQQQRPSGLARQQRIVAAVVAAYLNEISEVSSRPTP